MKVEEQTREIRESLNQITKLKEFQDGDYFLTSLILNPMIGNKNISEKILTEFIVKQKKQFHFRKSSGQIGGDFCITETISFRSPEDRYVFFLNADAMGKSMQGASGAIVLGTAILNIFWQAKNKTDMSKLTPSEWLEYVILELNNIFMTFDGSMLVSGFFGLVGENNRDLFYSNFEHPHAVMLRDNKAIFLDAKNQNSKLGVQSLSSIPIENTFLYPQDILIIGSDGKDDIEISSNNLGRSINEDETLILNLIEESKGDLEKLETLIKEKGELIDDLSLMKITVV